MAGSGVDALNALRSLAGPGGSPARRVLFLCLGIVVVLALVVLVGLAFRSR